MGSSASLTLAYGFLVENPEDHPWFDKYDDEPHIEWWKELKGFKPTFVPYDVDGEYVEGVSDDDPRIDQYYDEMRQWKRDNPIPFELEYVSYYDNEEMFVCAPTTYSFHKQTKLSNVIGLSILQEHECEQFHNFIREYYPNSGDPSWVLIPFYG